MPIEITCGRCQSVYAVREELAGKRVRCKRCGEAILVEGPVRPAVSPAGPTPGAKGDGGGRAKPKSLPPLVPSRAVPADPLTDPDALSGQPLPPPPPVMNSRPYRTVPPPAGVGYGVGGGGDVELKFKEDRDEEIRKGTARRPVEAPQAASSASSSAAAAGAVASSDESAVVAAIPGFVPGRRTASGEPRLDGGGNGGGSGGSRAAGEAGAAIAPSLVIPAGSDRGPRKRCPDCGAPQKPGELVCLHCGYNPVVGKRAADRLEEGERTSGAPIDLVRRQRDYPGWLYGPGAWDPTDTFALNLLIFGAGACVLPLFGLQWKPLAKLGAHAAFIGLFLGMAGSAAFSMRQRFGLGAMTGTLALMIFGFSFSFAVRNAPREDPRAVARDDSASSSSSSPARGSSARTSVDGGGGSGGTATPASPAVAAPPPPQPTAHDELVTLLKGPPEGEDPVAWHLAKLDHTDARVRLMCATFLASKTPEPRRELVARAFESRLADADASVRKLAIKGVALKPYERTALVVAPLLADKDPTVKADAFKLLATLKDPRGLDALVARLPDDLVAAREAIAAFLPDHAAALTKALEAAVGHADPRVKAAAAEELAVDGRAGPATVAALVPALRDADGNVRRAAMWTLARLKPKDPKALEALAARLGEDPVPASEALRAIGAPAEAALIPIVAKADADKSLRIAAVELLKELGTKAAVPALQVAAADADMPLAMAAVDAWSRIAPDAMTPVVTALVDLNSPHPERHRAALERLAEANVPVDKAKQDEMAKLLLRSVLSEDESVRRPALKLLPTWATAETVPALIKLEDERTEQSLRNRVHRALGALKDKRGAEAVVKFVATDRPDAAEALLAMGPVAEEVTIKLLYHEDGDVRVAACRILGEIGSKYGKAIPELQKLIFDDRAVSGEAARQAIEAIRSRPAARR